MAEQEPVTPNYIDMDGPALLEACGDDGMAWATAFCQTKKKMGWTLNDIDEGLMVAWFANAIERSWQKRYERSMPATTPYVGEYDWRKDPMKSGGNGY